MAANLDPAMLKQLQDLYGSNGQLALQPWDPRRYQPGPTDAQGNHYVASFAKEGPTGEAGDGVVPTLQNYSKWTDQAYNTPGSYGDQYDSQGNYTGRQFNDPDDGMKTALGLFLASVGGMQFLPGGAFGGAGGGAGGAAGSAAGDAYLPGQLGANGANLSASIPGTSFMNSSGLNTLLDKVGLAGGSSAASGTGSAGSGTFLGEGVASGIPAWDKAAAAASGGSGLLGLGASLLGGALGSQGVKKQETQTTQKDPRVDPYFFGDGTNPGLLQYAQQQLQRDMSPANLLMIDSLKSKGMGLLNQPVAGNGFGLFTKGKY